jgi:hypothetical protein
MKTNKPRKLADSSQSGSLRYFVRATTQLVIIIMMILVGGSISSATADAVQLRAGVAKVDITRREGGLVNDPLYVKALVLQNENTRVVLITLDAVAVAEIGWIKNDYLNKVRSRIAAELGIKPANILVNTSHCHGVVGSDVDERTVQAVREAAQNMVPVKIGAGSGFENRIMENRRVKLRSGRTADIRRAYSFPPDEEVAEIGPIDPQIGVLRLDRKDGAPLAVIYNFACHPIEGVPNGGNTADITGFASKVIEEELGRGAIAFFVQGAAGDTNPVRYKSVDTPHDAEPLGDMLGLSTMRAVRTIQTRESAELKIINETVELPRANLAPQIEALRAEQEKVLQSLQATDLNLKTFLPLMVKYRLFPEYPSDYSYEYRRDKMIGREDLKTLDAENRKNLDLYLHDIYAMEELTRIQTNLALLRMHQKQYEAAAAKTLRVEVVGLKVGDFVLLTFPGELTAPIGLAIKKMSPHPFTFVAGYTNGYIYYTPTAEQLKNVGHAQEDSDCLVAPEWEALFESKAMSILSRL